MAWQSAGRSYLGWGTEVDFLGAFMPEAHRILQGEPLEMRYHPPLYPILLALARPLTGDWVAAGFWISGVSFFVFVVASAAVLRAVGGRAALWGCLLALLTSPLVLTYASQSTSDMPYLGLYMASFAAALWAYRGGGWRWIPAGAILAAAVLMRANSLSLLLLAVLPLLPGWTSRNEEPGHGDEATAAGRAVDPASTEGPAGPASTEGPLDDSAPATQARRDTSGLVQGTSPEPAARSSYTPPRPALHMGALALGLVLVFAAWTAFATVTGAPLRPTHGHVNLALTYFTPGEDRRSGDAWEDVQVEEEFGSYLDVVRRDPLHIAETYVRDFFRVLRYVFSTRHFAFPIYLLALPGVWLLARRAVSPFAAVFLAATLAQLLLTNFKAYEDRYFMFAVPVLGAAAGLCCHLLWRAIPERWVRASAVVVLGVFLLFGAIRSLASAREPLHWADRELAEAIPKLREHVEAGDPVVCRKPNAAYYSGGRRVLFPNVESLQDLREALTALQDPSRREQAERERRETGYVPQSKAALRGEPVYVYFGEFERQMRRELAVLADPEAAPRWLEPLEWSDRSGAWAFYRWAPDAP